MSEKSSFENCVCFGPFVDAEADFKIMLVLQHTHKKVIVQFHPDNWEPILITTMAGYVAAKRECGIPDFTR